MGCPLNAGSDTRQIRLNGMIFQAMRSQVCNVTAECIIVQGVWLGYAKPVAEHYIATLGRFVGSAGGRRYAVTQVVLNSLIQPGNAGVC